MKTCLLILLFSIYGKSAFAAGPPSRPAVAVLYSIPEGDTSFRVVPAAEKTWGYEILVNGKALVRQMTIPGMAGNRGFKSKKDAGKIAVLVMNKLKQGIMPPTVYKEEMDRLRIKD
jgi:hypothetical protein